MALNIPTYRLSEIKQIHMPRQAYRAMDRIFLHYVCRIVIASIRSEQSCMHFKEMSGVLEGKPLSYQTSNRKLRPTGYLRLIGFVDSTIAVVGKFAGNSPPRIYVPRQFTHEGIVLESVERSTTLA